MIENQETKPISRHPGERQRRRTARAPWTACVFRNDDRKRKSHWCECIAPLVCTLLLAGCMHSTKADFPRHYTLGNPAPAHAVSGTASHGRKVLQISRVIVPPWLAGNAMYYRLDYRDGRSLASYAHSDWIAPPATLLESIIQNTIAADGNWQAVIGPGNPASADANLHVRLDDFSQAFSHPHASTAVIDATATLIDNRNDSVIGQRHWHIEVAAPTADAQGGAKALGKASRQLANDLQRWLAEVSAPVH